MGLNFRKSDENARRKHGGLYCSRYSSRGLANKVLDRAQRALQFYIICLQNGLVVVLIFIVEYKVVFSRVVGYGKTNVLIL